MKRLNFLLVVFFLYACSNAQTNNTQQPQEKIKNQTDIPAVNNPGKFLQAIEFKVKLSKKEAEEYETSFMPYVKLNDPGSDLKKLEDRGVVVLPQNKVNILFDYPLNKPVTFEFQSTSGFTREQLVRIISKSYHQIYTEEEKSASQKTIPADKRGTLINRNETDGKYGIWGHDLSDLVLSGIEVYEQTDGKILLVLQIES